MAAAAAVVALLVHAGVFGPARSSPSATVGSGVAASEARSVPAFAAVELAGSNNVTVGVGPRRSVVVHGDDNLVGRVTTAVHSGRLVIGNTGGSFTTRSPMRVTVTTPTLGALILSGSGNVEVTGIATRRLSVDLAGSGNVHASGSARTLDVSMAGSGNADLRDVTADVAHAVLGGSGNIYVTALRSLDAGVPGSGNVFYGGSPAQVVTHVSGSGTVIPTP